jgi:hypothetical protein
MPQFDTRQELDLLRTEAGELEVMLGQIRNMKNRELSRFLFLDFL